MVGSLCFLQPLKPTPLIHNQKSCGKDYPWTQSIIYEACSHLPHFSSLQGDREIKRLLYADDLVEGLWQKPVLTTESLQGLRIINKYRGYESHSDSENIQVWGNYCSVLLLYCCSLTIILFRWFGKMPVWERSIQLLWFLKKLDINVKKNTELFNLCFYIKI